MRSSKQQLASGTTLGGRYRVLKTLGLGGMACVYLAEDLANGDYVALKIMRDEISDDPEFIRRFATEARAAASLDHPNIVRVMDYGQDQDVRYIVQEYVHGLTLKELIQRQGSLDWQLAVPLLIQIALALEHAHRRGIIHRDMKPQNVLVTEEMVAKVTDFGIARASNANTITLTGGVAFGSVHYFSPEQARGADVTERSDLYSLGIMLYEALTGELPFDGESSVAVAIKQLQEMPSRPSSLKRSIPRALDDIIYKCIQKTPERRYQSARELVDELDAFLQEPEGRYGVIYQGGAPQWERGTSALGVQQQASDFNKMREIERNLKRSRNRRLRDTVFLLLFLLVILLASVFAFSALYKRITTRSQIVSENEIIVGRYTGRSVEDAKAEIHKNFGENFPVQVVLQKNATVQPGQVFDQEPQAEYKINRQTDKITLYVSDGQETVSLPNVVGQTIEEAQRQLEALRFTVIKKKEYSDTVPKGQVFDMKPEAGTARPLHDTIYLQYSGGSQKTTIPALEGLSWVEAKARAEEANLSIQGIRSVAQDANGQTLELPEGDRFIVKQQLNAGETVEAGTAIPVEYGTYQDFEKAHQPDILMPNFVGRSWPEVRTLIQSWGDEALAKVNVSKSTGSGSEEALVVVYQSLNEGETFDPAKQSLEIRLGQGDSGHSPLFPGP